MTKEDKAQEASAKKKAKRESDQGIAEEKLQLYSDAMVTVGQEKIDELRARAKYQFELIVEGEEESDGEGVVVV
jgi:hypothetical protein